MKCQAKEEKDKINPGSFGSSTFKFGDQSHTVQYSTVRINRPPKLSEKSYRSKRILPNKDDTNDTFKQQYALVNRQIPSLVPSTVPSLSPSTGSSLDPSASTSSVLNLEPITVALLYSEWCTEFLSLV
jgi:hypothetical protein